MSGCSSTPKSSSVRPINLYDLADYQVDLDKSKDRELSLLDRQYALASWVYSAVADRTYLEPETLCFPFDETWRQISINEKQFKKLQENGFFAQAWHRTSSQGNKELIIAYRGTDGSDDFWHGNFSFFKSPLSVSQFDSAIEFRDSVLDVTASDKELEFDYVVFVGHSLGGGLAQYAQDFTENSRAFVFNSSPNRGRLYSFFKEHKSKKFVTRLYEKGEILKWLRLFLFDFDIFDNSNPGGLGMNTRWFQFYKDHLIANHNMKDFSAALIKLAAVAEDPQAKVIIDFLKKRSRVGGGRLTNSKCSL